MSPWTLLERAFGCGGVLAYHGIGEAPHLPVMHVSPARLRTQLEHLRARHTVLPLRELVVRWHTGRSTRGCVAITFDDAYLGVLRHAAPLLKALELPATVFVAGNHAVRGSTYWWDDVEQQRIARRGLPWHTAPAMVGVPPCDSADPSVTMLLRERVLAAYAGRWPGDLVAGHETDWRSMTIAELQLLARDENIEFGVHTVSHPALPLLPYDEQVAEMRANLAFLRLRLPRVLPVVAYPYGLYDRTTVRAAREAGMIAGLTMEGRASADHPDPMRVPRVGAGDVHEPDSLSLRLTRALRPALVLRNRGPSPRLPRDPLARRFASPLEAWAPFSFMTS